VAIILDAWSRRVVGYAIGRSIDARLALAALKVAIARRCLDRDAFIIPTADRNTRLVPIRSCWRPMTWSAR